MKLRFHAGECAAKVHKVALNNFEHRARHRQAARKHGVTIGKQDLVMCCI